MNLELLFATPIGITKIDKSLCERFSEIVQQENCVNDTYKQCLGTDDDLHKKPEYQELLDVINTNVSIYSEEIVGIKKEDLIMTGMWANMHNSGSKHHNHQHPNSFISGVVYLQIPEECEHPGKFIFVDPRQAKNMSHGNFIKDTYLSNRCRWYLPETGIMILFPSWLEHGTDPYVCSSDRKRISLSFNFLLNNCNEPTMKLHNGGLV